jgi:D-alanyl-D-alanine carboxypeptidase
MSSLVGTTKEEVFSLFFDKMNELAKLYELENSKFTSFHGLPDKFNVSTAYDVAKLSQIFMQNVSIFAAILYLSRFYERLCEHKNTNQKF